MSERSVRTLRNVRVETHKKNGYDTWRLVHRDVDTGNEWVDPYFDYFADSMLPGGVSQGSPRSMRYNYSRWVAHFLDYLIEATAFQARNGEPVMTGPLLARTIRKYADFLTDAQESGDAMISEVARKLNASPCKNASQTSYIAAINAYLNLSEDFNTEMRELGIRDINGIPLFSETDLFPESSGRLEVPRHERFAITKSSMLAGVMAGGARLKNVAKLKASKRAMRLDSDTGLDLEEFYQQSHFPFDHTPALIKDGFKSLRDKALFCLLLACGCRLHEALLITWSDIDPGRQIVRLRSPYQKTLRDYCGYFNNRSQILDLPWKGRSTERVSLIEPFKTHFWRLLREYQQSKEFTWVNHHNFVFQVLKGSNKGEPLIIGDRSNIAEQMRTACRRICVAEMAPHSLRHSYGVYTLNFIPFTDGTRGMSLHLVADLMGHASLNTTRRYAIPDTQLQMSKQKVTLAALRDFTVDTSREMRLELYKSDCEKMQAEIEAEKVKIGAKKALSHGR